MCAKIYIKNVRTILIFLAVLDRVHSDRTNTKHRGTCIEYRFANPKTIDLDKTGRRLNIHNVHAVACIAALKERMY